MKVNRIDCRVSLYKLSVKTILLTLCSVFFFAKCKVEKEEGNYFSGEYKYIAVINLNDCVNCHVNLFRFIEHVEETNQIEKSILIFEEVRKVEIERFFQESGINQRIKYSRDDDFVSQYAFQNENSLFTSVLIKLDDHGQIIGKDAFREIKRF